MMKRNWKWLAALALVCAVCLGLTLGASAEGNDVWYLESGITSIKEGQLFTITNLSTGATHGLGTATVGVDPVSISATPRAIDGEDWHLPGGYSTIMLRTYPNFVTAEDITTLPTVASGLVYGDTITLDATTTLNAGTANFGTFELVGTPTVTALTGGTVQVTFTPDTSSHWSTDSYVLTADGTTAVESITKEISYTAGRKIVDWNGIVGIVHSDYTGLPQVFPSEKANLPALVGSDKIVISYGENAPKDHGSYMGIVNVSPSESAGFYDLGNMSNIYWTIDKLTIPQNDIIVGVKTGQTLVYDGTNKDIVVLNVDGLNTLLAAEAKDALEAIASTTVRDADIYSVTVTCNNDSNFLIQGDSGSGIDKTVTVQPCPVTLTWADGLTHTYKSRETTSLAVADVLLFTPNYDNSTLSGTVLVDGTNVTDLSTLSQGSHTLSLDGAALSSTNYSLPTPLLNGTLMVNYMDPGMDQAEANGTEGENGWYISAVTIDAPTGYTINVEDFSEADVYTDSVSLGQDFVKRDFHYTLKDANGGVSYRMLTRSEIGSDTVAPTVKQVGRATVLAQSETVDFNLFDATSDMSGQYTNDGVPATYSGNTANVTFTKNNFITDGFKLVFKDVAGNETTKYVRIGNIDAQKPRMGDLTITDATNTAKRNDGSNFVTITFSVADDVRDADTNLAAPDMVTSNELKMSVNGGTETIITEASGGSFDVYENGLYTVTVKDSAGNKSEKSITVGNFDNTAPVLATPSCSMTDASKPYAEVRVDVSDSGDSDTTDGYTGVASVRWEGAGTSGEATLDADGSVATFIANQNVQYTIYAKDKAGNESDPLAIFVDAVDSAAPYFGMMGWNVTSILTKDGVEIAGEVLDSATDTADNAAADAYSGIKNVTVTVSDGGTLPTDLHYTATEGSNPCRVSFTATTNGTYTVNAYNQGGVMASKPIVVSNIDATKPVVGDLTITDATNTAKRKDGINFVTITFTVSDEMKDSNGKAVADSYVNELKMSLNGDTPKTITEGETNFDVYENGLYTLTVTDKAGNKTEKSITVGNFDNTAPVVVTPITLDPSAATATAPTVSFGLADYGDADVGKETGENYPGIYAESVLVSYGSADSGEDVDVTASTSGGSFTAAKNGEYYVDFTDMAGNANTEKLLITVKNIDSEKPVFNTDWTLTPAATTVTKFTVTVAGSVYDPAADAYGNAAGEFYSGIKSVTVTATNGGTEPSTVTFNETNGNETCNVSFVAQTSGTYTVTATNKAGVTETKDIEVKNIDDEEPAIVAGSLTYNGKAAKEATNGSVKIDFQAKDVLSTWQEASLGGIASMSYAGTTGGKKTVSCDLTDGDAVSNATFTVTANDTYTVTMTDKAGNEAVFTVIVDCINTADPAAFSTADVTVGGVAYAGRVSSATAQTVVISARDVKGDELLDDAYAGIKSIEVAGVTDGTFAASTGTADATFTFQAAANKTYSMTITNKAGSFVTGEFTLDNYDSVAPAAYTGLTVGGVDYADRAAAKTAQTVAFTMADPATDAAGNKAADVYSGITELTVTGAADGKNYYTLPTATNGTAVVNVSFSTDVNQTYNIHVKNRGGATNDALSFTLDNFDQALPTYGNDVKVNGQALAACGAYKTAQDVTFTVADVLTTGEANDFGGINTVTVTGADGKDYPASFTPGAIATDVVTVTINTGVNQEYTVVITDKADNTTAAAVKFTLNCFDMAECGTIANVTYNGSAAEAPVSGTVTVAFDVADIGHDAANNATAAAYYGIKTIAVQDADGNPYTVTYAPTTGSTAAHAEFIADENKVYTLTITDLAGNVSTQTITVTCIDLKKPSGVTALTVDGELYDARKPLNEEKVVSFTVQDVATDNTNNATAAAYSGIKSVTVVGADGKDYQAVMTPNGADGTAPVTVTFTTDVNQMYTVTITDKAANTTTDDFTLDNFDMAKCDTITDVTYNGSAAEAPVSGTVTVAFDVADIGHDAANNATAAAYYGIKTITVKDADGNPYTVTYAPTTGSIAAHAEFIADENKVYTLTITDQAGNVDDEQYITVTCIDQVAASDITDLTVAGDPYADRKQQNTARQITFKVSDVAKDASGKVTAADYRGIASVTVVGADGVDYGAEMEPDGSDGDTVVTVSFTTGVNQEYTVTITDKAGNVTENMFILDNFDMEAPTEPDGIHFDAETEEHRKATSQNVRVSFTMHDIALGDEDSVTADVFSGVDNITVIASDGKEYPVTFTAVDGEKEVLASFIADENKDYTITVLDKAENDVSHTVTVDNIDRDEPSDRVISYDAVTYMTSTNGVAVRITATDLNSTDGNGHATNDRFTAVKFEVKGPGVTQEKLVTADQEYTFVATANGKYSVTYTDQAGNTIEDFFTIDRIDDTAPVVNVGVSKSTIYANATDNCALTSITISRYNATLSEVDCQRATEGRATATVTNGGVYTITVVDEAGNVTTVTRSLDDSDNDGLSDEFEVSIGTNPNAADTDGDGLNDGDEYLKYHTDPVKPDTDGDGVADGEEIANGLNPLKADTDDDGVTDDVELALGLNSKLNIAAELLLGQAYTKPGETMVAGIFGSKGEELFNDLVNKNCVSALTLQDPASILREAQSAMKKRGVRAYLVQFDANTESGYALAGDYLVAFTANNRRFTFTGALDLSVFGEVPAGAQRIVLPCADGSAAITAIWDGQKTIGSLGLIAFQSGSLGTIDGTDGVTSFAISADGSFVSYFKNAQVTVLNLTNGEATISEAENVIALSFDKETPIAVTEGGRAWAAQGSNWAQVNLPVVDMNQRTNTSRSVTITSLNKQITVNAELYVPTNGTGAIRFTPEGGKEKTLYTLGAN